MSETKKLYKVVDKDWTSPFQNYQYEVGHSYTCDDFDPSNADCSRGLYAVDLEGLPYSWIVGRKIVEVEVWGRSVEINQFKRRYEHMKILRECDVQSEIVPKCKEIEDDLGYRLSEVIDPANPRKIDPHKIDDEVLDLLRKWASARRMNSHSGLHAPDSVYNLPVIDAVRHAVSRSIWSSVGGQVRRNIENAAEDEVGTINWWTSSVSRNNVSRSVSDVIWAYIESLFHSRENQGIVRGNYRIAAPLALWNMGLIPSFDGAAWMLHGGKDLEILWEGTTP